MVNSKRIVNQILYADLLLSMDGIIPSASLWHEKMQRRIFSLRQTLQVDGASPEQAAAFCLLLCGMLDKRMNKLRVKNHWGDLGYSLTVYLFGQSAPETSLAEGLRDLAQGQTSVVSKLSQRLLKWPSFQKGRVHSSRLLDDWHEEPDLAPAQPNLVSVFTWTTTLLIASLSAFFLIFLWFFLKVNSHV